MKTTYRMKEATNKQEAIISILDVIKENPLFLNKCKSYFLTVARQLNEDLRKKYLEELEKEIIINLFVEIKTEYYYFLDVTQYNY